MSSIERLTNESGSQVIRITTNHEKHEWINYYENIEAAFREYKESRNYLRFSILLDTGFAVGSIIAGLSILLKDPNAGQLQIAGGIAGLAFGGFAVMGYIDSRSKLNSVNATISDIQNFQEEG